MVSKNIENEYIYVEIYNGVIRIYDKKTKIKISYWNHGEDRFSCLLHDLISRFDQNTDSYTIKDLIEKLKPVYDDVNYETESRQIKIIPRCEINNQEELKDRLNEIIDKPINIKIKSRGSWNTVIKTYIPLILKHSTVKCNGHYTDDYAYDNAVNFGISKYDNDKASDGCKTQILNDVQHNLEGFIKLYWDNVDKNFTIYYGQWLSYDAKPNEGLKLIFKDVAEKKPEPIKTLKKWVVFTQKPTNNELCKISVDGLSSGEIRSTKELLAYENKIKIEDIKISVT